jgi:hypothetical protein
MAQFLGDLAFLGEMALVALGLVLLHRSAKEASALLKVAGVILLLTGIGAATCTSYYWLKYHLQGDFSHAYPVAGTSVEASTEPP